jgi:hypothetical protein
MRPLMSKICARLDAHIDIRGDWPALLASAALFVGTLVIASALVLSSRPARAFGAPLAERIDWSIAAVTPAASRASISVLINIGRRAQFERGHSRRYVKSTKRQRLARHKRRRG